MTPILSSTYKLFRYTERYAKCKLTKSATCFYRGIVLPYLIKHTKYFQVNRVNLCCGPQRVPGYWGIDVAVGADLVMDLSRRDLPFRSNSVEAVVCTSAINYFSRARAGELIRETHRVLKPGGVARFSAQDMEAIARRYIEKDTDFFFQRLPSGRERFEGPTLGDKFAAWFYGYVSNGYPTRYFFDYESLSFLFKQAGFSQIERTYYLRSRLEHIDKIDNRPEQMFFLEAVK
jgi:SAM-dependent methyltransferase